MTNALLSALSIAGAAYGVSAATTSSTSVESATATSPTLVVSTAVASASLIPTASTLPSQLPLPPKQAWCPSEIFCAGQVLQTLNLAQLYADPKTVADKPTSRPPQQVLSDFNSTFSSSSYPNEGAVLNFTVENFAGEGQELAAVSIPSFNSNPKFLGKVKDNVVKQWSKTVNGYWTQLIRDTNQTNVCKGGECESSLIPLNHTFVVPGGRFREQYYWDSFWIVEGLLRSELYGIANATLQNFMDELENFGFIPNGGRIYYLDRSQPPLFTHMLSVYVEASNDTSILKRALPLAERELKWWDDHRSVNVTSGSNKTHTLYRYAVNNTAPRPESYFQDYTTASDASLPALNETERSALYAELASGAETGWDYSSRWFASPDTSGNTALRSLQVSKTIPVDLNSILYYAHVLLSALHKRNGEQLSSNTIKSLTARAVELKAAIIDTFWDESKFAFYDYVLSSSPSPIGPPASNSTTYSGARSSVFSAAHFYPLWVGIYPPSVLANSTSAFSAFSSLNLVLNRYNGTLPATLRTTGQQWDAPNAWPPHQYIALEALRGLPSNITSGAWPSGKSSFELIPQGQLGLDESALPTQPLSAGVNASRTGTQADINALNGTVVNGGNATQGEGWGKAMQRALANRYITSALCSWRATGGAIAGVLPRLTDQELNVTQSVNNTGNMFEKFSALDVDSAGRGGEYTVQAGFGWTNGVVLWVADTYGDVLVAPSCPDLLASAEAAGTASSSSSSAAGSGTGTSTAGASNTGTSGGSQQTGAAGRVNAGAWVGLLAVLMGMMTL